MIGIQEIATYLPEKRLSNFDLVKKFELEPGFIENKIGISSVSIKEPNEEASDLCVKAFRLLEAKTEIDKSKIDCLIVVTQNGDYNLPHTSAIVHGKLDMQEKCACFDISLGCSGFVYGLSVIESFMSSNNYSKGLLFTADPYSKVIDNNDKNTRLLFGDAATVTLITNQPVLTSGKFNFGTIGKDYENLICKNNILQMNGRMIFNFAAKYVPEDIKDLLLNNNIELDEIDLFVFHQGSKFIVDTITKRMKIESNKVPFNIQNFGNTISSSIPIILEEVIANKSIKKIVVCGFGVGLSWSSTILTKI
ncbi:MAG: 3-oxoacyl-ACP synthase [Bacteroidetes bacterium GWF2_33_16]|nr:MAG: 3-oxoacyl-ACP synthase [Bacteroidetes bacterium GWE2_32_14]OFY05978.1 MAG: 3-oxoacyl-ACP synthase [Bacteroidetes bacterium GWF2_33_16]